MAAFNSLSDLRQRYANDPTRLAAINAGAREGIAEARGRPNSGLAGLRERSRAAYAAASTPEAFRTREAWVDAESRPGAAGLEAQARHRTANMFGANTRPVSVGGVRDLGSMTGAEAEARVRANPRLAEGGVFGRNDRAAAMQRNQDFIRSGRASMFGPRPATTKGILSMRNAELKGQELENTRRADAMRAANDRYNAETTRQGNSILAGLRGEELRMTGDNNKRAAENERLKIAQRETAMRLKTVGTVLDSANVPEEMKKAILENLTKEWSGGGEQQGGETPTPAAEQEQPAAPTYKYQERPEGDLNNKDVQAYYAERGIGPKSWLKALRNPAQPNQQAASPAGTSRQPTLAELGTDPASVASPEAVTEQAPGATKPYVMLPIPSRPQAPYTPNFLLPPTQSNSSLNSLSGASIPAAVPKVDRETARMLADPMRKFNPFYKGF